MAVQTNTHECGRALASVKILMEKDDMVCLVGLSAY